MKNSEPVIEKLCKMCNQMKPRSDFNKRSKTKDGLQSECKPCHSARYQRNREQIRAMQRISFASYSQRNSDKLKQKNVAYRMENTDRIKDARAKYEEKYAPKLAAKNAVWSHLLTGKMVKSLCEKCGEKTVDAHHDDYAKPLDVRWLCRRHHAQWHAENGPGKNGESIAIEAAAAGSGR